MLFGRGRISNKQEVSSPRTCGLKRSPSSLAKQDVEIHLRLDLITSVVVNVACP